MLEGEDMAMPRMTLATPASQFGFTQRRRPIAPGAGRPPALYYAPQKGVAAPIILPSPDAGARVGPNRKVTAPMAAPVPRSVTIIPTCV